MEKKEANMRYVLYAIVLVVAGMIMSCGDVGQTSYMPAEEGEEEVLAAAHENNGGLTYGEAEAFCEHLEGFGITSEYFRMDCVELFADLVLTNKQCENWIRGLCSANEKKEMITLWPHPCGTICRINKCTDEFTLRQCYENTSLIVNCDTVCQYKGYTSSYGCFTGNEQVEFLELIALLGRVPVLYRFGDDNASCLCN